MGTLKRTAGGALLRTIGGALQSSCCGATSPDCTLSGNPVPAVKMTVSWSGGPATRDYWGYTFSNGVPQIICPTSYGCNTTPATSFYQFNGEVWQILTFTNNATRELKMQANRFDGFTFSPSFTFNNKSVQLRVTTNIASPRQVLWQRRWFNPATYYTTYLPNNMSNGNINVYTFDVVGNAACRKIMDNMFGQVTSADGITFKWERAAPTQWNTCGITCT